MMELRKAKTNNRRPGSKIETVAIIGYGSQGRAIAQNLSDSGYRVLIGLRAGSKSRAKARRDGLTVGRSIPDTVRAANIVCLAIPDHLHGRLFKRSIAPYLKRKSTLMFLHATSVHFQIIKPPQRCDVVLLAPHAPGQAVRDMYLADKSLSAFYAVYQNPTGEAIKTVKRLAKAVGVKQENLIKSTFHQESVGDLFGEQAVLCGGLAMLIKAGFEVLVSRGWNPENAYLEVAYQLDLIISLVKQHGIGGMFSRISPAAQFGSLGAGPKLIDRSVRKRMDELFDEIESGAFAKQLYSLDDKAVAGLSQALKKLSNPRLEKAARKFSK
jgi:ketol-acid reductoisomerase